MGEKRSLRDNAMFRKVNTPGKLALISCFIIILFVMMQSRPPPTPVPAPPPATTSGWAGSFLHTKANKEWSDYFNAASARHKYTSCSVNNLFATLQNKTAWWPITTVEGLVYYGDRKLEPLQAKIDNVPCQLSGCCEKNFYFRYNTTDIAVFNQVFRWHYLRNLYLVSEVFQPKYILDAGANAGFSTALFKSLWPQAVVISLEPDEENFKALARNTADLEGVQVVRAGLWRRTAKLGFLRAHGEWGNIFGELPKGQDGIEAYSVNEIAKKFDIPAFDFIKIDIEGAEGMVFDPESDTSWVAKTQLLSLEVHDYFGHFFGLSEVSTRIDNVVSKVPFTAVADNEHVMYLGFNITKGLQDWSRAQQEEAQKEKEEKDELDQ